MPDLSFLRVPVIVLTEISKCLYNCRFHLRAHLKIQGWQLARAFTSEAEHKTIKVNQGAIQLSQRTAFAAELRRQIESQQDLKQFLEPSLVDGVIALLKIELHELERDKSSRPQTVVQPRLEATLELDTSGEIALVNLLMGVVAIDGLIKQVELRRIADYFRVQLNYTAENLQRIDGLIRRTQEIDMDPDVAVLARPFLTKPPQERILIYSACADIAFADDEFADEEKRMLTTLAELFCIDAQTSAGLLGFHTEASLQRQELLELKVRGQFPSGELVRFESVKNSPVTEDAPELAPQCQVSPKALTKTVGLMAMYLAQEKGHCATDAPEWGHLWKGCPGLVPPDLLACLTSSPFLKALPGGHFGICETLEQRQQVEARLFAFLIKGSKPVSIRLVARASKSESERTLQLLSKYVCDCEAFVRYGYGCGTWFGLAVWGRRGYEETVRQNLGEIRKQLERGHKASLSPLELQIIAEVAYTAKNRALLELVS